MLQYTNDKYLPRILSGRRCLQIFGADLLALSKSLLTPSPVEFLTGDSVFGALFLRGILNKMTLNFGRWTNLESKFKQIKLVLLSCTYSIYNIEKGL